MRVGGNWDAFAMEERPIKHVVENLRGLLYTGIGQCTEQLASALIANMLIQA